MKPEHELTLRTVRNEQLRIHRLVLNLDARIEKVASEMRSAEKAAPPVVVAPTAPPPTPIEVYSARRAIEEARPAPVQPEPVAESIYQKAEEIAELSEKPAASIFRSEPNEGFKSPVESEPEQPSPSEEMESSFELTFGRVWLVRLGMVILLTGLVFLGNLAYQNIVPLLGPGMKLSLIYLAGAALSATGVFLERKRESVKNYARVLLAGGLATIYYATYAAHFVTPLQVIESPLIGGALLLGLAVAIGVAADRRKSQTLALIAVVLSYYTSGLNPIGSFTLFSSFLLTATAVFFLLRHRWVQLAVVSMAATYASYVWCRFTGHAPAEPGVLMPLAYLAGYWIMFAVGGFVARAESLAAGARAQLLTLNNVAFAAIAGFEITQRRPDLFWAFSLGFGLLLLVLGRVARFTIRDGRVVEDTLAVQGFALTTLGLATKLTGQQFALTLAAQSVLVLAGRGRPAILRVIASVLSAGGAVCLASFGVAERINHAPEVAGFVSVGLLAAGWLYRRRVGTPALQANELAAGYTAAALALAVASTWSVVGAPEVTVWMIAAALVCAVLPARWNLRELTLLSQALVPIAAALWVGTLYLHRASSPIQAAMLIAGATALSLWWSRGGRAKYEETIGSAFESAMAFSATVGAMGWIWIDSTSAQIVTTATVVGVVSLAVALFARARWLSVTTVGFALLGIAQFAMNLSSIHWAIALLPIGHLVFIAWVSRFAPRLGTDAAKASPLVAGIAVSAAAGLTIPWTLVHIPAQWQAVLFASEAVITLIAGAARKNTRMSYAGAGLMVLGWCGAMYGQLGVPVWQQLLALILIPAGARIARKLWPADPLRDLAAVITWAAMTGIAVWTVRWCDVNAHQLSLTLGWTFLALAFFAAGLALRDRHYRLGGLGLLGLAIGRVFFVDVWALDSVLRILSFLGLGTVLLLVGYFYNRFEGKIRQWL